MAILSRPTNLYLTLLFSILALFLSSASSAAKLKETKMSFYFQDFTGGPKSNDIPIAGVAGKLWTFTQFGTIYVNDDPMTETPDPKSALVGHAQGMYVVAGQDARPNAHVMLSLVFSNKVYNGSTLEIQGASKQFEAVREVAVVGGTGKFRYARGYATFETYSVDIPNFYSVIRCNVSVFH